jgi:CRISPR-associated endonuclease/helicase Cas3
MRSAGLKSALDFAKSSTALFGEFEPLGRPDPTKLAAVSWSLVGLANLADWIGSSRTHFPYHAPNTTLSAYWAYAQAQAVAAVNEAGIAATVPSADQSVKRLFPGITTPSPLQAHLASVELPDGPLLAIVEDVTGSGKTEAAILLAGRLIAGGRAYGLFFALPTMATANAMFDRLSEGYRRLFADASQPSLVLAHGRRALHPGFEASILPHAANEKREAHAERIGDASSAVCAAWIADDRRKAFLAHVGVGTVDQAFLAALPVKHQAMRLWGLADRVLIVDEAHAYDAYMGRELERVLEFHAALGGTAIILSATLPAAQREALLEFAGLNRRGGECGSQLDRL